MSHNNSESMDFYKYLCHKIGSEEVVRARRLTLLSNDFGSNKYISQVSSGSKGEGLNLQGSDTDLMFIDPIFIVYESEKDAVQDGRIVLVMDNDDTHPCFTRLRLYTNSNILPHLSKTIIEQHKGNNLLSSEHYKLEQLKQIKSSVPYMQNIHGPCITDLKDEYDLAYCLKCDQWVSEAKSWISRPRTTWPAAELISKISQCGILLVPIGYKGSINENLQWRISFSVAEKILIYSFSHTQLLCYALLKILLKEIVERNKELKGLLCSYFLKTLMFWISEETELSIWRPVNIIPCFMACLQRLIYCVEYSILLHYFIPENNLFYLRFNGKQKNTLLSILENSFQKGIKIFSSSETLHGYRRFPCEISRSVCLNATLLQEIADNVYPLHRPFVNILGILNTLLNHCESKLSRCIFTLSFSFECQSIPLALPYINNPNNKQQYKNYKHDLSQLLMGLHSDAVSGWLTLASFFYVHKRYLTSIAIINYTLSKCSDHIRSMFQLSFSNSTLHQNQISTYKLNPLLQEKLMTVLKSIKTHFVIFMAKSSVIPKELKFDVMVTPKCFEFIPFAHFLSFLCSYHLQNFISCRYAVHLLSESFIEHSSATRKMNLNTQILLGIVFQLFEDRDMARQLFSKVAQSDRSNITSAAFRLAQL